MTKGPIDEGCTVAGPKAKPAAPKPKDVSIPVIPIVFLPGIMGSNLRVKPSAVDEVKQRFEQDGRGDEFTEKAWSPPSVEYSKLKTGASLFQETVGGAVNMAKRWHPPSVFGATLKAATTLLQKTVGANCQAVRVGKAWEGYGPKLRQVLLNPETVEVDDQGFLPKFVLGLDEIEGRPAMEVARERGWGTVHWDSYWKILKFLEHNLNGEPPFDQGNIQCRRWRAETLLGPGLYCNFIDGIIPTEAEVEKALANRFPVHAMGYNWTQSNLDSAREVLDKIELCISGYRGEGYTCTQVILVTHSMGGLVARVASQLDRKKHNRILGVVHGVMPATGAPDAYRTMVAGAEPGNPLVFKDLLTVFASLAGKTAAEATPVMANAPGALELLPSHLYPSGWLKVERETGDGETELLFALPEENQNDPYTYIYKEKDAWWRLVDPDLLDPAGMASKEGEEKDKEAPWRKYLGRINYLVGFHLTYLSADQYHLPSFIFFGKKQKTLAGVHWQLTQDSTGLSANGIRQARINNRHVDGSCEIKVIQHDAMSGKMVNGNYHFGTERRPRARIQCPNDDGDGTVPAESGNAPIVAISNTQGLHGFKHAEAYKYIQPHVFTMMAVCKIVGMVNTK